MVAKGEPAFENIGGTVSENQFRSNELSRSQAEGIVGYFEGLFPNTEESPKKTAETEN